MRVTGRMGQGLAGTFSRSKGMKQALARAESRGGNPYERTENGKFEYLFT